jgi:plastocyanin
MRRMAIGIAASLPVGAAALVPTVALGGARASSTHVVVLKALRFHPSTLTIRRGESVEWLWRDGGEKHNVTFHATHSHTISSGSYTLRFTRAGTFGYRCTIHEAEGMRGKIVVH